MKACPFCAEQIQDAARVCRFCQSVLDGKGLRPRAAGINPTLMLHQLREWAAGEPERPRSRRRISVLAIVLTVLWAGATGWLFVNFRGPDKSPALIMGGLLALIPLCAWIFDLTRIFPESCDTPARALKGFGQALGRKNYTLAFAFLPRPERESKEERRIPPLQEVTPGRFFFGYPNGFGSYWNNICASAAGRPKNVSFSVRGVEPLAHGFATGTLRMNLQTHSSTSFFLFGILGYLLSRSTIRVDMRKLLIEQAGRWFVANGEAGEKNDMELINEIQNPAKPEIEL